jgi:hypothetical protein
MDHAEYGHAWCLIWVMMCEEASMHLNMRVCVTFTTGQRVMNSGTFFGNANGTCAGTRKPVQLAAQYRTS